MFIRPYIKTVLQPLLKWLVLCALMLNVSVPAGAMLERGPEGNIQVVICSAQGMMSAWLDIETGDMVVQDDAPSPTDPNDPNMPSECPMASPAPLADSAGTPAVIIIVRIALPFCTEISGLTPVIGQSPARLSARGPPISV